MKKLLILIMALASVFCLALAVNAVCSEDRDLGKFDMVEKYYGDTEVKGEDGTVIGGYRPGGNNSFSAIFDDTTTNTGWAGGPAPRWWDEKFNITFFYAKSYLVEEITVYYVTRGEGQGYAIEISNDGGATWQEVGRYEAPADFTNEEVVTKTFSISDGNGMMGNAIRLKWVKGYTDFQVTFTEVDIKAKEIFDCQWDDGKVTTAETCGTTGIKTYTCSKCNGTKEEVIPATGNHTWDNGVVTLEPTESSSGSKLFTCTVCSDTKTDVLPAVGHNWDNGTVVAPTCETDGYTVYSCTDDGCQASYKDLYVDKLGHAYNDGVETKHPTLVAEGELTYSCTREGCDSSYTETLPQATMGDSSFVIGLDNIISFEEYISSGLPHENRDYKKLFDGIKVNASNSQSSPGGWFAPAKSTLTIVFDEEYYILGIDFYAWSNWNGATIEFFNAAGHKVIHYTNSSIQQTGGLATPVEDAPGKLVKSMKITINSAKGAEGIGNCLDFQEFVITAHKHLTEGETARYDEVPAGCEESGSYKKYCYVCEKETSVELAPLGEHDFVSNAEYANGYGRAGNATISCSRCDYSDTARIQPLFYSYGYSVREFGEVCISYKVEVNLESLETYNEYAKVPLSYGIVAAATPNFETSPLVINDGKVEKANSKVAVKDFTDTDYVCFEYTITNIPKSAYDTETVLCAYVFDGAKISYIDANTGTLENYEVVTYNGLIAQ